MLTVIFQFFRWVFEKFAVGVLIVGLGLAACGLWLFLHDDVDFDQWRANTIRAIEGERTAKKTEIAEVHKSMDRISVEITAEQEKGKSVDKILDNLKDLQSTWDKYTGQAAQYKSNEERIESLSTMRMAATAKTASLQQDFNRTTWERDARELELGKIEARLSDVQERESQFLHYVELTWNHEAGRGPVKLPLKDWAAVALGIYFLGPTLLKLWIYFSVAPRIARGRPVRLALGASVLPDVSESRPAVSVTLRLGERLWVKQPFLPAETVGGAKRGSRALLDWTIPFTCFATGLVKLTEVNQAGAGGDAQIALKNPNEADGELAVISLPEGASLVLRPTFLAGVVTAAGQGLKIRRRWQLFRSQSWVTRQFRFFEFVGPCQLVVAGSPGVRVEQLLPRDDGGPSARRANRDATMGFTPGLDYRAARTQTFWGYYRGSTPLFDDVFAGQGIFLCQGVKPAAEDDGEKKPARRVRPGMASDVKKLFGI